MKTVLLIVRWVVGILFIFSGLIKVNDPVGLSYKMQEFFEVGHLYFLNDYALLFAIVLNVFEVLAGVAVIIGWQFTLFSRLLLVLIVFFTFLTGYALFSGKIKACGCFGDCIPITPAQSFGKDILLLVLIVFLLLFRSSIQPSVKPTTAMVLLSFTLLGGFFTQWYVMNHLPFVDCLPYKKGNDILQKMQVPPGAVLDSFAIEFVYKKDGKTFQFDQEHFPDNFDSTYEYIDRVDRLVKPGNGIKAAISDFSLQTLSGMDSTQAVFSQKSPYVLVMIQDAKDIERWKPSFDALLPRFKAKGLAVYLVCPEAAKMSEAFPLMQVFSCDATVVKTAARVKPTYILMQEAAVLAKYSYLDAEKIVR